MPAPSLALIAIYLILSLLKPDTVIPFQVQQLTLLNSFLKIVSKIAR